MAGARCILGCSYFQLLSQKASSGLGLGSHEEGLYRRPIIKVIVQNITATQPIITNIYKYLVLYRRYLIMPVHEVP